MSNNNRYKLYLDKNINLCETIVIKLEDVALAMNYAVIQTNGINSVDFNDRSTWKYYQNIAGEYHFSDSIIKITSLDVNQQIDFTKANLLINKNTRKAYEYGTRYYRELVSLYPEQELLILGILYPSDINVALDAKEGTILTYPKNLVEDNEYSFIEKLQKFIYNYLFRWVNRQYAISDNLYTATYIAQLYLHLLQACITIRLENCKTNQAHSYHIQQYLASHGFLDNYIAALTKDQALFFYRNIKYIERNAGKKDVFSWLVENIMTNRNIAFYELIVNHKTDMITRQSILPELTFKRKPLNTVAKSILKANYDFDTVLDKIKQLAIQNDEFQTDRYSEIKDRLIYSDSSVLATKTLESYIVDTSNLSIYPLNEVLYNHWIYTAALDKYKASVFVTLPKENISIRLSAQESVAIYNYCIHRAYMPTYSTANNKLLGIEIPKLKVNKVIRTPIPQLSELISLSDNIHVSAQEISNIHDTSTAIVDMFSISDFRLKCVEIEKKAQQQYFIYCSKENMISRGISKLMADRLYCDVTVTLDQLVDVNHNALTYGQVMSNLGINLSDYSNKELLDLATAILLTATDSLDSTQLELAAIQKSMVSLFQQLSSYSIQVITDSDVSAVKFLPTPAVRIGDVDSKQFIADYIPSAPIYIDNSLVSEIFNSEIDIFKLYGNGSFTQQDNVINSINISLNPAFMQYQDVFDLGGKDIALDQTSDFNIEDNFNTLTLAQQQHLFNLNYN